MAQRFGSSESVVDVEETMEEYIEENHIEDIESIVHEFTGSKIFLDYLLEQGHHVNKDSIRLRRKDIRVGKDIDVYVRHFTEHQNFTMLMVPVDIYPFLIYDTLLFSVLEVSDEWLRDKFYYHDLSIDSVKSELMAKENHELLTRHMFEQILKEQRQSFAEIEVRLHESYISTNSIEVNTHDLDKKEKEKVLKSWGVMKRLFMHNLELNVEMNIYIFSYDDMRIIQYLEDGNKEYRITPKNVFTRHHFEEE